LNSFSGWFVLHIFRLWLHDLGSAWRWRFFLALDFRRRRRRRRRWWGRRLTLNGRLCRGRRRGRGRRGRLLRRWWFRRRWWRFGGFNNWVLRGKCAGHGR
jgi:hypothetical protein